MKFSCSSCNTKYSLPDEKFAGKVIALTCKKCGAKIVVKPEVSGAEQVKEKRSESAKKVIPQASSTEKGLLPDSDKGTKPIKKDAQSGVYKAADIKKSEDSKASERQGKKEISSASHSALSGDEIEKVDKKKLIREDKKESKDTIEESQKESEGWYYSRGGQQRGPYTDEEISEMVENNVITPKTFVWKDGMMDWMRAGICNDFRHFFGGDTVSGNKEENAINSLGLEELDKKLKQNDTHREEEKDKDNGQNLQEDFFSKKIENPPERSSEDETDWSRIPSIDNSVDAPRENTRILIMKAGLSESAKRKRMLIRVVVALLLLCVFVFVIIKNMGPILSAVGVKIKSGIDLEMKDLGEDMLSKMSPEERERYKKALLGIKETKRLTREQKRSIAMAITQKKNTDLASILENAKVEGGNIIYENLGRDRMGSGVSSGVNLDLNTKLVGMGIDTKIEGADLSFKVERQAIDLSQKMPDKVDTLNEDVIMMIVNKNRGSVKYCYERHLKASSSLEGKAIFKITIINSGVVSKIDSLSKQIAGSLFEECIIKEIKKWTFPKFTGDPVIFEIPFVLTSVN